MENTENKRGIELLETLDRVVIRERNGGDNCKYVVVTAGGEAVLTAHEDCGLVSRLLAGRSRAFQIDVMDSDDREVMKLRRPHTIGPDKMDVTVLGQPAAVVRKEVTLLKPVLSINDASDRPVLRVKGPVAISAECNFELYSADKKRIGDISKRWGGAARAQDRDCFALRFPLTLDVRYKAALIGTCFLIDFLFYEN